MAKYSEVWSLSKMYSYEYKVFSRVAPKNITANLKSLVLDRYLRNNFSFYCKEKVTLVNLHDFEMDVEFPQRLKKKQKWDNAFKSGQF